MRKGVGLQETYICTAYCVCGSMCGTVPVRVQGRSSVGVGNQDAEWGNNGLTEIKAARGIHTWSYRAPFRTDPAIPV